MLQDAPVSVSLTDSKRYYYPSEPNLDSSRSDLALTTFHRLAFPASFTSARKKMPLVGAIGTWASTGPSLPSSP